MSLGMNDVPAGNSEIAVPASLNVHPVAGTTSGASSRRTRCVSVAERLIGRGGGISQSIRCARVHDVFVRRTSDGGAVRVPGHGQRDRGREPCPWLRRRIPSAPDQRVAARQQKRRRQIDGIGHRSRIVTGGSAIQPAVRLAAAIRRLVHHLVRAAAEIDRFENVEVERILDASTRVPRRQREIDDDRVAGDVGVELAEGLPDDLFVLAHGRKCVSAERRRFLRDDLNPGDMRIRSRGEGERAEDGRCEADESGHDVGDPTGFPRHHERRPASPA